MVSMEDLKNAYPSTFPLELVIFEPEILTVPQNYNSDDVNEWRGEGLIKGANESANDTVITLYGVGNVLQLTTTVPDSGAANKTTPTQHIGNYH